MDEPIYVIKNKAGFPAPHDFRYKYTKVNIQDISGIYLEKEFIILYKFKSAIFGTYEKDFLYRGHFDNLHIHTEKHIWIKDFKKQAPIKLSKRRLLDSLELYLLLDPITQILL